MHEDEASSSISRVLSRDSALRGRGKCRLTCMYAHVHACTCALPIFEHMDKFLTTQKWDIIMIVIAKMEGS